MTPRQKRGVILILAGLVLLLGYVGLRYTHQRQDEMAGQSARILLQHLELSRVEIKKPEEIPEEDTPIQSVMPEKAYLDYSMIGTLRIPSLEMELPILSSWSYELLNVAPCRYYGSIPEGNMVLMGHNYKSHFTPLHGIEIGAQVEFENVNGMVYRYVVAQIEYLHKNQGEQLASEHPLILLTCTDGGQNRVVVRCDSAE